jgi:O-acetyl-ADP-ribose deacetylase (regulator of RNase III)
MAKRLNDMFSKNIKEVEGDLIELAKAGEFDAITHGVNCFCRMRTGIAVPMRDVFGADKFPMEAHQYIGDINKLGQIDFRKDKQYNLYIINSYTQYKYNIEEEPEEVQVDYDAMALCFKKINHVFKGKRLGLPKIGCGRAGGQWKIVNLIIERELTDVQVTIVHHKK